MMTTRMMNRLGGLGLVFALAAASGCVAEVPESDEVAAIEDVGESHAQLWMLTCKEAANRVHFICHGHASTPDAHEGCEQEYQANLLSCGDW